MLIWLLTGSIIMNINDMTDYCKGEYDCVHGHEALPGQSPAYYEGYGDRYAQEQCDTAKSEVA